MSPLALEAEDLGVVDEPPPDLPSDSKRPAECALPRGMWSKPERSLGLLNPSQGFSLPLSVPLPPERLMGVFDAVTLAIGLDRLYATIPRLALGGVARALAKLARDVRGRGYAGSGDGQLAALCDDTIRDGQLTPCRTRGNGQLARLSLKTGELLPGPGFVAVDPGQFVLAKAALQLLRSLALRVVALDLRFVPVISAGQKTLGEDISR